jgi:hypothetical protein
MKFNSVAPAPVRAIIAVMLGDDDATAQQRGKTKCGDDTAKGK